MGKNQVKIPRLGGSHFKCKSTTMHDMDGWIMSKKFITDIVKSIISSVLTALILSLFALAIIDNIFSPPRLSGLWQFEITYQNTSYSPFQDLRVTYQAVLVQNELRIGGSGDKFSEKLPDSVTPEEYEQGARIPITITGYIERKIFGKDTIFLSIMEEGANRDSSAFHELKQEDGEPLIGTFYTTIANSSGPVAWIRR